ncbi:MAG: molecular chaperone HtpG [Desulfoplanes sp.]
MAAAQEHCEFKTEIKKLLDIITNSLYTNREIFMRELISNASDALDKLRFETSRGTVVQDADLPLEITIEGDEKASTLTLKDTGIGMSRDEIVQYLGTIANSGSEKFLESMAKESTENKDASEIIGRFGVGFYSVFMVADKVIVTSKSYIADEPAVRWTSDGLGSYDVETLDEALSRGTNIEIHFKEEYKDFAGEDRIKHIIKTHSNFVSFPIKIKDETINSVTALWREPKFSIKQEQYDEFYKFLTYDSEAPLDTLHVSVDAPVQFKALMFLPAKNHDIFNQERDKYGLDLYVRRVLIQKENNDLLPQYLGFMKGLVDTEDLPLNISRETLQENRIISKIKSTVTKQILSALEKLAKDDPEKYAQFWKEHSKIFKIGYMDFAHKDRFAGLLRFNSSIHKTKDELTSLADYISRAKEGQKEIYYISGQSREAIELNPLFEIFNKKGIEVLYLYEPIDEFALEAVGEFEKYKLKAAENADMKALQNFSDTKKDEKDAVEELSSDESSTLKELLAKIKDVLGDKVTEVRLSTRLTTSPACLVSPDGNMSSQMQKIMRMVGGDKGTSVPTKVMEINGDHPLVRNMITIFDKDKDDAYLASCIEQLYESSLLLDGYLSDPHKMVNRINDLLEKSSGWYKEIKKM